MTYENRTHCKPEFESLKDFMPDMALERSVDALLDMIVHLLAERPHIALVRIWLIGHEDTCPVCPMLRVSGSRKWISRSLTDKEMLWNFMMQPFPFIKGW